MGQTCSAGLASWDCNETIDDLLRRADEALYLAKASGRNQRRRRSSLVDPTVGSHVTRMGRPEHERAVRFRTARRDPELTVVEGFHALKHALRFGAELVEAVAVDPPALEKMAADLAPDLAGEIAGRVETVDKATLADLVPLVPDTGVAAIARRPRVDLGCAADPLRRRRCCSSSRATWATSAPASGSRRRPGRRR